MEIATFASADGASIMLPAGRSRARGYLLGITGMLAVTSDAVFVRLMEREGGTVWVTTTVKMFATAVCCTLLPLPFTGIRGQIEGLRTAPFHFLGSATLQGIMNLLYSIVFLETSVAKALMLISLHPLWSALAGWRLLGDPMPIRTVMALAFAIASVVVMFVPPAFLEGTDAANTTAIVGENRGTLHGDLLSLVTGLCVAGTITISRHTGKCHGDKAALELAAGLGTFVASLVALPIACAASATATCHDFTLPTARFYLIAAAAGVLLAICLTNLLILAPRHISSAEVALILLGETILSPLWVYLGVGEAPTVWTLGGGALLIATLFMHELAALREARRETKAAACAKAVTTITPHPDEVAVVVR